MDEDELNKLKKDWYEDGLIVGEAHKKSGRQPIKNKIHTIDEDIKIEAIKIKAFHQGYLTGYYLNDLPPPQDDDPYRFV